MQEALFLHADSSCVYKYTAVFKVIVVICFSFRSKLSAVNSSTPLNHGDLPAGVKVPQVVLASEPVPPGDIAFVSI